MNGMIFAAGLGTRLAPLTDNRPKALVEVGGRPLLAHAIEHFRQAEIRRIVINVHHFAQQIKDYISANASHWPDTELIISDESDQLLDTGGGLAKALPLFNSDAVVVGNADVLCDVPLQWLIVQHKASGREATLLTKQRPSTRQLLFDADGRLSGWTNKTSGEVKMPRPADNLHESAFCGFHVIETELLKTMLPVSKFPIIDAYLQRAAEHNIGETTIPDECYWFDVGTVEKLRTAEDFLKNRQQ
ncbi:MAG: nucleotidyltransferase family protein [Bacteroidales bacterium]|nr:nucleotidyltransferase family protein [Bacteroidales bacterium]